VVSVGARISKKEWAPYSNRGPWVHEARNGTNIISTHPQTFHGAAAQQITQPPMPISDAHDMVADSAGFVWWSGTSFAAAIYAGQLAGKLPGGQGLP
jgi:subtilisin family serine protease